MHQYFETLKYVLGIYIYLFYLFKKGFWWRNQFKNKCQSLFFLGEMLQNQCLFKIICILIQNYLFTLRFLKIMLGTFLMFSGTTTSTVAEELHTYVVFVYEQMTHVLYNLPRKYVNICIFTVDGKNTILNCIFTVDNM